MRRSIAPRVWLLALLIVLGVVVTPILAATIKTTYQALQTAAYTDGYGGAVGDLAADEAWDLTADIDMETAGYIGLWVWLEHDSSGTTDNIIFGYFDSPDGTDVSDVPLYIMEADSDGSDDQIGFYFSNPPPHGKFGVKTSGTTDTFDYRIRYRGTLKDAS